MKCPIDNETLVISDRGGVEIDYCPKCRGVWLDRGELDKIIERSVMERPAAQPLREQPRDGDRSRQDHDDDYRRYSDDDDYRFGKKKKRESWLGELFDF
ncbi:TFIIB-type zinc ribbon-containing protein [Falsigemmobacter faecalis]|uniref:Transcription factor zinc-finger domain-containing protein n=1 Tax=Falsigemmobacter faecalis TaxID=2488730 RepID=A0A3P3D3S4_9RHOB|nr:zf-TFIIB domain-containing protein [Falsigemmobacter faecalis]RRH69039.1 hypothetical protein EG244_18950 [Falsigemmobacter faecalis]